MWVMGIKSYTGGSYTSMSISPYRHISTISMGGSLAEGNFMYA